MIIGALAPEGRITYNSTLDKGRFDLRFKEPDLRCEITDLRSLRPHLRSDLGMGYLEK